MLLSQTRLPDNVLTRQFDYNFSLELLCKDVMTSVQHVLTHPTAGVIDPAAHPLLEMSAERVGDAARALADGADHTELAKLSEQATGVVLE